MVGASSAGCEAFKNLILPGIGKVVIIDDKKVTEQDIKSNFFLTQESLGKNRDEETLKHLLELNPDVDGASFAALGPEESLKEYADHFYKMGFKITAYLRYHYASCIA